MLYQNVKQINIKNFSVSANFKKEAIPKPARIFASDSDFHFFAGSLGRCPNSVKPLFINTLCKRVVSNPSMQVHATYRQHNLFLLALLRNHHRCFQTRGHQ